MAISKRLSRKTRSNPSGYFKINNELKPLIEIARAQGEEPSLAQVIESNRFMNLNKQTGANVDMTLFRDFALCPKLNPMGGPRISFSRASGATRINQAGLIEYAPENLITYSEEFSNGAWIGNNSDILDNTSISPDGSYNADTLSGSLNSSYIETGFSFNTSANQIYSISFYIKKGTYNWAYVVLTDRVANSAGKFFNLIDGTIGNSSLLMVGSTVEFIGSSIEPANNGFFRCSIIVKPLTSSSFFASVGLASGDGLVEGDTSSNIHVWGAQLERAHSARTYNKTEGSVYYGPRFDYDPVTHEAKGLLIEESRTNSLLSSERFDDVLFWNQISGTSVTANAVASPDGNMGAEAIVESAITASFGIYQSNTITGVVTFSIFAKAGTRGWLHLQTDKTAALDDAWINLIDGSIGTVTTGSVTVSEFFNGWHRVSWSFTATRTNNFAIYSSVSNNSSSYAGVAGAEAFYLWGAQLEAGPFSTTYIPTTSSAVTRAADLLSIEGNDFKTFYNSSEGSFLFDGTQSEPVESKFPRFLYITPGEEQQLDGYLSNIIANVSWRVRNANYNEVALSFGPYSGGASIKVMGTYGQTRISATINGSDPFEAAIDGVANTGNYLNLALNVTRWYIKKIGFFSKQLSNSKIKLLTS